MGSGKATVAQEVGLALKMAGTCAALVDLDWLGWVYLRTTSEPVDALIARNLAAIWPNLRAAGATRLVLARGVMSADGRRVLREAVPDTEVRVVLLTASPAAIRERLPRRDTGDTMAEHLLEAASMAETIAGAGLQHAVVTTDSRSARDVALDVLRLAGWW